ncbi:putative ssdna binding protein [Erysiphe neolycopersici]|uniref:Putative ssdna binding protein n=1 Tax=Erysiphe neolycopersici TaxID=212602 RepID=A0A420I2V0_9PEZI|nr:putative ssdna binding protein [Erysiphe neolycopersici]
MSFYSASYRAFTSILPRVRVAASSRISHSSTFAKITLVGRLGDTPELQPTSTGKEILKYSIGTSIGRGENKKTSWFRVTGFLPEGPQREFIAGLEKGTLLYVEGNVTMNQYQDAEGNTRNALNIVQQKIEVLLSKRRETEEEPESS